MQEKCRICVENCYICALTCDYCAMSFLKEQPLEMMRECIRLAMQAAILWRITAKLMTQESEFAGDICSLCARACLKCSDECVRHKHEFCSECAQACQQCAEECRKIIN